MANKNNKDDDGMNKGGDFKISPRTWVVWMVIIGVIMMLMMFRERPETRVHTLSYNDFITKVESNQIASGTVIFNPQSPELKEITGRYYKVNENGKVVLENGKPVEVPFQIKTVLLEEDLKKVLKSGKFETREPNTLFSQILIGILPVLIIVAAIYFFLIRQIKTAGKGALTFGKSKVKMLARDKNKTTFEDVAGIEEAKEEVQEVVEFLKDPKKFQRLGARIPKGILMVGAPGTGKTLLAKAIAGEADASFFSISGSDFVEMFVGVGASRVRDMFEQARKNIPCLIFIDEIDAVGRSRGHGLGGGNDEREQTLNALLVEMDGFDTQEGIIIIAATNRPDVLDPALLRPGRFDRQIYVNLPDVRGREAILKVHSKKVKLDPSVDLSVIARATPGYSGAELANLLNEAALLAARNNKKAVTMVELEEARVKVRWGRERRSLAMSEEEKRHTAWHEAGHALVNVLLPHTHPLHRVTIIPRGQSLGATMQLPKGDVLNQRKKQMLDTISVMMAGRIAEEIASGDVSSGAANDIQQATAIAKAMVCQWGMSERLGMIQYGSDEEYVFLGRDMFKMKAYSEATAREIDAEVKRIIDECYNVAKNLLEQNKDKLAMIANALLEYESLDGKQVEDIVKLGKFTPLATGYSSAEPPKSTATAPTTEPQPKSPTVPGIESPAPAPV